MRYSAKKDSTSQSSFNEWVVVDENDHLVSQVVGDPKAAEETARLFSKAPEMAELLRGIRETGVFDTSEAGMAINAILAEIDG